MQSNNSTRYFSAYVYANVFSWRYTCVQPRPNEALGKPEPRLHLDAVIDSGVLPQGLLIELCIICEEAETGDEALLSPWQLDLTPANDDDPALPMFLSGILTVTESSLLDLKNCLFLAANSADCSVQVQFSVKGNEDRYFDNDVAEGCFMIAEFGYTLNYQKECK